MNKKVVILYFFLLLMMSCVAAQNEPCQEGIELLPMYGGVEKCQKQLDADEEFLKRCDAEQPDRFAKLLEVVDNGWAHLHRGDYNTAMKRLNQAWLLDSTEVLVYISFMVLLDLTDKTSDVMYMLDLSLDKINAAAEPKVADLKNLSRQMKRSFLASNIPFTYKKTKNKELAKHFLLKIENSSLDKKEKEELVKMVKDGIPELD